MPKFLEVTDITAARGALGVANTVGVSQFVDSTLTYEAAIVAAAVAAGSGGVVDFEGVTYETTGTVTITTAGVTLSNGGITAGQFTALHVNADDVAVANMNFERSTQFPATALTSQLYCVYVTGERFSSLDCNYTGSVIACLHLGNGQSDGAVVRGGTFTTSSLHQNACGIAAGAGSNGNRNITIDSVYVHDCVDGILLFDTSDSLVTNCRVESLRQLGSLELTGWTNVTGNIWRQRSASGTPGVDGVEWDNERGTSQIISVDGTFLDRTFESTTPAANEASTSGGYVYINLDGTDPNTVTVTSDIVSGYGYLIYSSVSDNRALCSNNRITDCHANDTDGFGIYLQLGVDESGLTEAFGNVVSGVHLTEVNLTGNQFGALPFAAIGMDGGRSTLITGCRVRNSSVSGSLSTPGVKIAEGASEVKISDTVVDSGYRTGFEIQTSDVMVVNCEASNNAQSGFSVSMNTGTSVVENVSLLGCVSRTNSAEGITFSTTSGTTGHISGSIVGCTVIGNTRRGIHLASTQPSTIRDVVVVGNTCIDNGDASFAQIAVSGESERVSIVANLMKSQTANAEGLLISSDPTDCVVAANIYDITNPESISATVTSNVAITELDDVALTDPKINAVKDVNGNALVDISAASSAANYLQVSTTNAGAGGPAVLAVGADTNIPLNLWSKGSSGVTCRTSAGTFFAALPASGTAAGSLRSRAATTGNDPALEATGSDTDVSINLVPKGSGTVKASGDPLGVKVAVPASAGATGVVGQWAAESGWLYICVATNTWERVAIASW